MLVKVVHRQRSFKGLLRFPLCKPTLPRVFLDWKKMSGIQQCPFLWGVSISKFLLRSHVATNKTSPYFDNASLAAWPQPLIIIIFTAPYIKNPFKNIFLWCSLHSASAAMLPHQSRAKFYLWPYSLAATRLCCHAAMLPRSKNFEIGTLSWPMFGDKK